MIDMRTAYSSPRYRSRLWIVVALGTATAIAAAIFYRGSGRGPPTVDQAHVANPQKPTFAEAPSSSVAQPARETSPQGTAPTVVLSARVDVQRAPQLPASPIDLASPKAAVETQIALLRAGRDDEFRKTFVPSVVLTDAQVEACRQRVSNAVVKPDWEMAEDEVSQNHRVRRVSMFGKSMTGFHEFSGKWLADAPWCVPLGLP
ncbi:MAG: hypothetical protein NVS3B20_00340 [Polyangiales bacterium]